MALSLREFCYLAPPDSRSTAPTAAGAVLRGGQDVKIDFFWLSMLSRIDEMLFGSLMKAWS